MPSCSPPVPARPGASRSSATAPSLLTGERTTDEDGEIDVDVYASGNPGDATYEVTFTPADGEPCTGTLGG